MSIEVPNCLEVLRSGDKFVIKSKEIESTRDTIYTMLEISYKTKEINREEYIKEKKLSQLKKVWNLKEYDFDNYKKNYQ